MPADTTSKLVCELFLLVLKEPPPYTTRSLWVPMVPAGAAGGTSWGCGGWGCHWTCASLHLPGGLGEGPGVAPWEAELVLGLEVLRLVVRVPRVRRGVLLVQLPVPPAGGQEGDQDQWRWLVNLHR